MLETVTLGPKKWSKPVAMVGRWCRGSGVRAGEEEKVGSRTGSICFLHLAPDTLDVRQRRGIFTCSRFAMWRFSGAQGQSGSIRGRVAIPALSRAGQGNGGRRLVKSLFMRFIFRICRRTAGRTLLIRCLPAASCSGPPGL